VADEGARHRSEHWSRVVRSRPVLAIGIFLLALGVVCLFFIGPKTGLATLTLGVFVVLAWAVMPYVQEIEITPTRFHARMSDPKGGVEEIATRPLDHPEAGPEPGRGRLRRLLHRRPRNRGSERD
jgi:hypothetical protein